MGRLSALDVQTLSVEQKAIYDDILLSRKGNIDGPFLAWLHSPALADKAQKLGAFCRYNSSLPARLSELAILITARHWRANLEWIIHAPIAASEGLSESVIEAIQAGSPPDFQRHDESLVYELATQLIEFKRVPMPTYKKAVELLGETPVVDLVGILGYYALVAMTLNVFEVDTPEGVKLPFTG